MRLVWALGSWETIKLHMKFSKKSKNMKKGEELREELGMV